MKKWYKECPFCANEIKEWAIKCQYCHERLNKEEIKEAPNNLEKSYRISKPMSKEFIKKIDSSSKHKFHIRDTFRIIIWWIIMFLFIFLLYSSDNWMNNWNTDKSESLEVYYCRWAWNIQWETDLRVNKLFESDPAWWWWYTASEWQTHKNNINKMYNNCLNYKTSIENDIKTYWYVMNEIQIDESIFAYCLWKRKYLEVTVEKVWEVWWVTDFTPSVTVKDTSIIIDTVKSCVEDLNNSPKWFVKNMRKE